MRLPSTASSLAWLRCEKGEGLGRSRSGVTTKLHLSTDGRCRPLSLIIPPAQRADYSQFQSVLRAMLVRRTGPR